MTPTLLVIIYGVFVVLSSLLGGWLPTRLKLTHTRMQLVLSFVGGMMLGIAMLHLLPHAIVLSGNIDVCFASALVGLLFMFFLIRAFHFHQHGPASEHEEAHADCGHDHGHHHAHDHGVSEVSWMGIALGMSIHTLIDGIALGAAVLADHAHVGEQPALWGLGVFFAVLLHKPLDALSITMVMRASGWTGAAYQAVNFGFSILCPIGAILVVLGLASMDAHQEHTLALLLAFSAGVFLCVSLSDLLPEVQFHRHDRIKLSAALLLGVCVAFGIGWLEPEHSHSIGEPHDHPPHTVTATTGDH